MKPKLDEYVANTGGGMYVSEIFSSGAFICKHHSAPWVRLYIQNWSRDKNGTLCALK